MRARSAGAQAVLATSIALTLLAPMGASAQRSTDGSAVAFRGPARVMPSDVVESVVALEGPTRVDGVVIGDVVAIGGDVTVTGTVGGDVVALAGVVRLAPTAQVGGDLVTPREPVIARGAQVRGVVQAVGEQPVRGAAGTGGALRYVLGWLAMTVSAILLALALGWLVPRRTTTAVLSTARSEPGKALGVGLVIAVLLPVIALAAMITVVGIPFGVAIMIASGLLAFVGFVASGWVLGRWIASRAKRAHERDPLVWVVLGVAALCAVTIVPVVGTLVWIVAAMYGVGSIALTFYDARRERRPGERRPRERVERAPVERAPVERTPEPPPHVGPPTGGRPAGA